MENNNRFDTTLEALTPEGVQFVLSPAGLPVRALAYTIDKVIQWLLLIIIAIISASLRFAMGMWFFLILLFLVDWFYHIFCELAFRGQSLGKRITGIRVVKSSGAPVDPASSFLRNLLRFADTFLFFFPIALLTMSASSGFRRLGDWAGDTVVVYSRLFPRSPANLWNFLAKYDPIIPPRTLSGDEKQAILNFSRRYALLGDARANEIAGIYVPCLRGDNNNAKISNARMSDAAYLLGIARYLSGAQTNATVRL